MDAFTPDAWAVVLDDVPYAEACEAVRRLGKLDLEPGRARYIEPGHIRGEVKRIRAEADRKRSVRPAIERGTLIGQQIPHGERMRQVRELIRSTRPRLTTDGGGE